MHSTRRKLLLPLAAASMISLPTSARALAFATRAAGGVRVRGGGALLAAQTVRPSPSSSRRIARSSRWGSPRMELAVDSSPLVADATDVEPLAKTPANKLLYAPPKFTPIPYE